MQLQFAFQILMVICYGFIKISIVCLYRRIFVTHKRKAFNVVTTAVNVVLFLWSLTFVLIIIFPCGRHMYANWGTPASQMAYCDAIGHTSEEGLAASDLILDVVLLVLPLPSVSTVCRKPSSSAHSFPDLGTAYDEYKKATSLYYTNARIVVSASLWLNEIGNADHEQQGYRCIYCKTCPLCSTYPGSHCDGVSGPES